MRKILMHYTNQSNSFMLKHRIEYGHFNMKGCHSHARYEINYLASGKRYFFIKDRSFLINQGDMVFVPPGELHKSSDTGVPDPETIVIEFDKQFILNSHSDSSEALDLLYGQYPVLKLALNKQQYAINLLNAMMQEIREQNVGFELYVQSLLQQLIIFATRNINQSQTSRQYHLNPTHAKIAEVVNYMNQNFQKGLSLETVGEAFQINSCYLSRLFKKVTGFTFIEYLNSLRIKEAQRLLEEPKIKVITIANQVGFENQSHFGRVFKSIIGISPLQYRKEKEVYLRAHYETLHKNHKFEEFNQNNFSDRRIR